MMVVHCEGKTIFFSLRWDSFMSQFALAYTIILSGLVPKVAQGRESTIEKVIHFIRVLE